MTLLTIVVPAYNAENFVARCLDSLTDPRFDDRLEVIVVNDGSTDRTAEIAESYALRYPKIVRMLHKENGGHGSAVNMGLDNATGKYFRIVDADDWVGTDDLAELIDIMDTADSDIFIDERTEIREDTGESKVIKLPLTATCGHKIDFDEITGPEYYRSISMHALSVSTRLLKENNLRLLEHTYYVDMQYVMAAVCLAKTVYLFRGRVYRYRLGAEGQSVHYLNYVRNYAQHDRVLKKCISSCRDYESVMPQGRQAYAEKMLTLMINTQYKISLINNPNRRQGSAQAKELSSYLRQNCPRIAKASRRRRFSATILHFAGIGYPQLQRIKSTLDRLLRRGS